ncbi:sulfotransferase family protein [Blastococcus sp. PRF04-17]|uniref:sulfotransferase family protein n=1 Tax=Blastococcus sp. PRF04-17 TaxID=2933797 RepID=UPI001FF63AB9|nr:sulfotransferase [Blastococcus sp. PRF04-17]UOY02378.1 sulfotransferase [Blastococcus sp. PRF04-17]
MSALPTVIIVGAMKCGTTSLHRYLDLHPQTAMSHPKELNFFIGPDVAADGTGWARGNWHRGTAWYAAHFDPSAQVRGEASPGYTSPDHPEVAGRMAALLPSARLVYAVRDPIDRAVSQYRHHRREGTERRPLAEALLDPASQYVSRGRYFERLAPFLACGAFADRITIVAQEELRQQRRSALRRLFADLRIDHGFWSPDMAARWNESRDEPPAIPDRVRHELAERLRDDAERLRQFAGRGFPGWTV